MSGGPRFAREGGRAWRELYRPRRIARMRSGVGGGGGDANGGAEPPHAYKKKYKKDLPKNHREKGAAKKCEWRRGGRAQLKRAEGAGARAATSTPPEGGGGGRAQLKRAEGAGAPPPPKGGVPPPPAGGGGLLSFKMFLNFAI